MTGATLAAAAIAAGATGIATLAAVADTAALSFDDEGPAGEDPPDRPTDRAGEASTARAHRVFTFAKVLAQLIAGAAAARALELHIGGSLAQSAALLVVLLALLLAEAFGRVLGGALGPRAGERLSWFRRALEWLFTLYLVPAARLDAMFARLLAPPVPDAESREETSEQFREVVSAEADVSDHGARLLDGALSLGATAVSEVMVPRVDILGIDIATPWSEVVDRLRTAEHARLPAYAMTVDDVRGILYAKDVLLAVIDGTEPDGGWQRLVRPATFVPTSKPLDALLAEFRATRTHIAIVVDEYGGTAGLVTIENILEEIVGDIRDEHDVEEADDARPRHESGRWWISGRLSLDELAARLDHTFVSEDDAATVGGWVYERLGRVPHPGEEFIVDGFRVVVERVRRRAVDRVYFERLTPVTQSEASAT